MEQDRVQLFKRADTHMVGEEAGRVFLTLGPRLIKYGFRLVATHSTNTRLVSPYRVPTRPKTDRQTAL